jgi:hypothetical protein
MDDEGPRKVARVRFRDDVKTYEGACPRSRALDAVVVAFFSSRWGTLPLLGRLNPLKGWSLPHLLGPTAPPTEFQAAESSALFALSVSSSSLTGAASTSPAPVLTHPLSQRQRSATVAGNSVLLSKLDALVSTMMHARGLLAPVPLPPVAMFCFGTSVPSQDALTPRGSRAATEDAIKAALRDLVQDLEDLLERLEQRLVEVTTVAAREVAAASASISASSSCACDYDDSADCAAHTCAAVASTAEEGEVKSTTHEDSATVDVSGTTEAQATATHADNGNEAEKVACSDDVRSASESDESEGPDDDTEDDTEDELAAYEREDVEFARRMRWSDGERKRRRSLAEAQKTSVSVVRNGASGGASGFHVSIQRLDWLKDLVNLARFAALAFEEGVLHVQRSGLTPSHIRRQQSVRLCVTEKY